MFTSLVDAKYEKPYQSNWVCADFDSNDSENHYYNLDGDPMIEVRASVRDIITGFESKHDSGTLKEWGHYSYEIQTLWVKTAGPLIGFHYTDSQSNLSLIIGDKCRPKYFGAGRLSLVIG